MSRLFVLVLLFFTTACISSVEQLQKIKPTGNEYQINLANEYLQFAEAEADQYDWFDSSHFARKGLKAAKGIDVEPENIRYWDIEEDSLPTLMQARQYLISTLDENMKLLHPKEAAKAQFLFDCWVEQEEELWQETHIAYCRENFYKTLDKLYILANNDAKEQEAKLAEAKVPEIDNDLSTDVPSPKYQKVIKSPTYLKPANESPVCVEDCKTKVEKRVLYFDFDSSKVTGRAKRVINEVTTKLSNIKNYEITLNGYADRIGNEDYNMQLSKKRAEAVKKELVSQGIDKKRIVIYAFGEFHGLIETDDEVAEKENRAVQVILEM